MRFFVVSCFVLAPLTSVASVAAQPTSSTPDTTLSAADSTQAKATRELIDILRTFESGSLIRTLDRNGTIVEGELLQVGGGDFILGVAPLEDERVDAGGVEALWRATGNHRARGSKLGVLIGGLGGAAYFLLAVVRFESESAVAVAWGAGAGSVLGGVVGTIVGWGTPRWELKHYHPQQRLDARHEE